MKQLSMLCIFFMTSLSTVLACNVCQDNQPEVLKNITHGTGPEGNMDYVIIWMAAIIVAVALFFSLKYIIRPGEQDSAHIKYRILNQNG